MYVVCCRKEKANVDLCCCGLKVNDASVVSHNHPATQPTAVSGGSTKPEGAYSFLSPPASAEFYDCISLKLRPKCTPVPWEDVLFCRTSVFGDNLFCDLNS